MGGNDENAEEAKGPERKHGKTQAFAAPKFDEDDESAPPPVPRCPKCKGAMKEEERGGMNIMTCSACSGLYLGPAQVEELFEKLLKQQKGADSKKATGLLKRFFGS